MKASIISTFIFLAITGQMAAGQHTVEPAENNTSKVVFQIAAGTVPCSKGGSVGGSVQMKCVIVNGETFYDVIDGYDHQEGIARTVKIARTQICNPDVFNSCPQDISSIYSYRLLEIIE